MANTFKVFTIADVAVDSGTVQYTQLQVQQHQLFLD